MARRVLFAIVFSLLFLSAVHLAPRVATWVGRVALDIIYAPEHP